MTKNTLKNTKRISLDDSEADSEKMIGDSHHDDLKIINISIWSKILSWVVLVIYISSFFAEIAGVIQSTTQNSGFSFAKVPLFSISGIIYWTNLFTPPVIGLTFFLVLQAISQGILMFMDIDEKN